MDLDALATNGHVDPPRYLAGENGATSAYPWWHKIRYNGDNQGYVNSIQDWGWGSYVYFGHAGGCTGGGGGGSGAAGGQSDIWFDNVTVTRQ